MLLTAFLLALTSPIHASADEADPDHCSYQVSAPSLGGRFITARYAESGVRYVTAGPDSPACADNTEIPKQIRDASKSSREKMKDWKGPTRACVGALFCQGMQQPELWACAPSGDKTCPTAGECFRDKTFKQKDAPVTDEQEKSLGWGATKPKVVTTQAGTDGIWVGLKDPSSSKTAYTAIGTASYRGTTPPSWDDADKDYCVSQEMQYSIAPYPATRSGKTPSAGSDAGGGD